MQLNRSLKRVLAKAQKGFTLIELAIVGLFLGILAIYAVSQFTGGGADKAKANSLYEAATKMTDNWSLIAMECGISKSVGGTTGSGKTNKANLSYLLGTSGTAPTGTNATCLSQSGARPLSGVSAGAAGSETVQGFAVSIADIGSASSGVVGISYAVVTPSVFQAAYDRFGPGGTPAASLTASASTPFAWSAADASGNRTITFVRPL
ncbi:MAG: hypothetical protein ACOVRP_13660 [Gemmatimonas sp.]